MIDMLAESATAVRKEWSAVCDSVIHGRPKFIKRTRDKMMFSSLDTMSDILSGYQFTATKFCEDDDSITLVLNEIDLVENGLDEQSARSALAKSIMEYSLNYYNEYELFSRAPNRKGHIPYILKALIVDDEKQLEEMLICQDGKS